MPVCSICFFSQRVVSQCVLFLDSPPTLAVSGREKWAYEGETEPSVNSHSWAPLEHWEVLGGEQSGRVDKQNRQALKKAEQTWFSDNHLSLTDWGPG